MSPHFNAAFDPWVPVESAGVTQRVSLRDALVEASSHGAIAPPNALAVLPLHRLLVALTLRIFPELHDVGRLHEVWRQGGFDASRINDYLEAHRGQFEVFHPEHPFLQVADLRPSSGEPKSAAYLLPHRSTGNNVPLFSSTTEADKTRITVPDALLQLLIIQNWDTAAIKTGAAGDPKVSGGKTTGNPTGVLGQLGAVMPVGRSLFETLLLNVPRSRARPDDLPVWERDIGPSWEIRPAAGPLDHFTWPGRRIRLVPDDDGLVTAVVISAGDRLAVIDPTLEPHTRWRRVKGGTVPQRPLRWRPGAEAWRGLDTLLALQDVESIETTSALVLRQMPALLDLLGDHYPLKLFCCGVAYGNQSAVIEDVFIDALPLPTAALRDTNLDVHDALVQVSTCADEVRRALNDLADNLRELQGAERLPWDSGVHPGNDTLMQLSEPTHRLLAGLQREPERLDEGLKAWQAVALDVAWEAADTLLNQANRTSFAGRTRGPAGNQRTVRLADVEEWFRAKLRKALPLAYQRNEKGRAS